MSLFNWNGVRFPGFTMQQLNLDWILTEIKRIMGYFPEDGATGTVLMKTDDGTAWEELPAIDININGVPEDTELSDTDKLIFYDISASANRKITAPNLLNAMMSNGTPLMDGTASAGTSKKPARYDHRHPTDTSRQAALSGVQMAAVNSGAPANSFDSNGILKFDNGGLNDSGADYCKMPDGTLIQWGIADNTSAGYAEITFPMTFLNRNYAIVGAPRYSTGHSSLDYFAVLAPSTSTGAMAYFRKVADLSVNTDTTAQISWYAIGRWK